MAAAVFFRKVITSGFDVLTGDRGDMRLVAYLHEHWLEVLKGHQPWLTPNFFHSMKDTLGYSDTFLINEVFYAPLRLAGFDRYLALQLTIMALCLLGFVGYVLVCTRLIGTGHWTAVGLAIVATFANNLLVQAGHPQMFGVVWVPWMALIAAAALTAPSTRRALAWWALEGVLLGLLLYSTYYVGWFTTFAIIIFGLRMAVHLRDRLAARTIRETVQRTWRPTAAFLGGFALMMVPFALTYLPALDRTGGRKFDSVLHASPELADVVNVSDRNFVWGGLLRAWRDGDDHVHIGERSVAMTPLLLLALSACGVAVGVALRGRRDVHTSAARSLLTATFVLALVTIRIGDVSLWRGVWTVVPGARALRAIARIGILAAYIAPAALAVSVVALRRAGMLRPTARIVRLAPLLLVALVVEQFNLSDGAGLDRPQQLALMARVTDPPERCTSFFIADVPDAGDVGLQIDAMVVAQLTGVPTMNGYSGASPGLWDLNPHNDDYLAFVQRWNDRHDISGACAYDRETGQWDTSPFD